MSVLSRFLESRPRETAGLAGLLVLTVVAVVGYGLFAVNPERLPPVDWALEFFTISFQFFAQLHIAASAVALGLVLVGRLRARWLAALGAVYVLSFLAEHIGTGYGIPFGGYGYTGLLGYKLGGRVPFLIPLSWFLMALPSWVLARAIMGSSAGPVGRVLLGSLWLVAWDLALDPAMSFLTVYWRWEETGPYYGMPWLNLAGWYVTGLVLLTAIELLADRSGFHELPTRWMAAYYGTVALLPMGMLAAAGAWLGVFVTLAGMAGCLALCLLARRAYEAREEVPSPAPARAR
jgi:putative membrane protein